MRLDEKDNYEYPPMEVCPHGIILPCKWCNDELARKEFRSRQQVSEDCKDVDISEIDD